MSEKQLLSRREVSQIYGVTEQTVSNYVSNGWLSAVKMSGRTMVTRSSVMRVFDNMKTDDEIALETKAYRLRAEQENAKARKEYAKAHSNSSMLTMLGSTYFRDILITIIKSMGYRHLDKSQENMICTMMDEWSRHGIEDKLGVTYEGARYRMRKALRAISSLPSYSELEDKIDTLNIDNKALADMCSSLKEKIASLEKRMAIQNDSGSNKSSISIEDVNTYELLQTRVDDMPFQKKAFNVFQYCDIKTLYDLVQYKPTDLLKVRFVGRKTVSGIEDILATVNLTLGMDVIKYKKAYAERANLIYTKI